MSKGGSMKKFSLKTAFKRKKDRHFLNTDFGGEDTFLGKVHKDLNVELICELVDR